MAVLVARGRGAQACRDHQWYTRRVSQVDRSHYPVRKLRLEDEGKGSQVEHLTAAERVAMVWQLTVQAWTFKEGRWDEPRLRRDVVRVVRRPR